MNTIHVDIDAHPARAINIIESALATRNELLNKAVPPAGVKFSTDNGCPEATRLRDGIKALMRVCHIDAANRDQSRKPEEILILRDLEDRLRALLDGEGGHVG